MWRIAGFTGAVGIEVAVAIAIGALGGQWLDRKLGTNPWLTYIGFIAGIGAAIKALVRVSREYKKRILTQDEGQSPHTPTPANAQEAPTTATTDDPDAR